MSYLVDEYTRLEKNLMRAEEGSSAYYAIYERMQVISAEIFNSN